VNFVFQVAVALMSDLHELLKKWRGRGGLFAVSAASPFASGQRPELKRELCVPYQALLIFLNVFACQCSGRALAFKEKVEPILQSVHMLLVIHNLGNHLKTGALTRHFCYR
jgi:hypothetical protein